MAGQKLARCANALIIPSVLANARHLVASVSTTYFHASCRQQAYDVTSIYWDSRAQDRATSVEALRQSPIVVTDARR